MVIVSLVPQNHPKHNAIQSALPDCADQHGSLSSGILVHFAFTGRNTSLSLYFFSMHSILFSLVGQVHWVDLRSGQVLLQSLWYHRDSIDMGAGTSRL